MSWRRVRPTYWPPPLKRYTIVGTMGENGLPSKQCIEIEEGDTMPDGVALFPSKAAAWRHARQPVSTPPPWAQESWMDDD